MAMPNLTRVQAEQRADLLDVESYHVELDLTDGKGLPGDSTFSSTTTVRFRSRQTGVSTWIDLVAAEVHSAVLNGVKLDVSEYREDEGIALPNLAETNELVVNATCRYMNTGEGLHRFVDPVDNEVYLYTQFEHADAKRMFTCFDQPDLKATYQLTVVTPGHWKAISNTPNVTSTKLADGTLRQAFAPTAKLSTYLVALVAGPYSEWRDEYRDEYGTIPLGLYCRASLAEYFDPEQVFTLTKQGFGFFHRTFQIAYPFDKYDQLFVPEFNAGAMENPGCVTFLEDYVFRSKVTDERYQRRCQTLLHEMAHMWFGDLVTMRWWDDLWLNESFADWASLFAQAEATQYTESWASFAGVRKSWAYVQDKMSSTHPIVMDIPDIDSVRVNFDGITYAKGASVLKQLAAYVGLDNFLTGLRSYFNRHAWTNATLADLLAALEESSGRDLSNWSQQWLHTTGLNVLRPEYTVDSEGKFASFAVVQEGAEPGAGELRPHRLAVGVYGDSADGKLVRIHRIETDIAGERTEIPELIGLPSGKLVLVNDDDLTYCNLRLDEKSLTTLVNRIADIAEPLPRILCWSAAWEMTREAEMKARDFVELVLGGIHAETEMPVLERLLLQARTALNTYVDPEFEPQLWSQFASRLLELARTAEPGSDKQLAFVKELTLAVLDERILAVLSGWLDGSQQLDGLEVDVDLRWSLLKALVAHGVVDETAIDAELEKDSTSRGQRNAETARALLPTLEAKEKAWQRVMGDPAISNDSCRAIVFGFQHPNQKHLLTPFNARYFSEIEQMWQQSGADQAWVAAQLLFPLWAVSEETLAAANEWLQGEHPSALRRMVVEGRDRVIRALKARAFDKS